MYRSLIGTTIHMHSESWICHNVIRHIDSFNIPNSFHVCAPCLWSIGCVKHVVLPMLWHGRLKNKLFI
jgi:hypothetical protein